jgi:hypothetical protein
MSRSSCRRRLQGSNVNRLAVRSQQKESPTLTEAAPRAPSAGTVISRKREGASTDLDVLLPRLQKVGSMLHMLAVAQPNSLGYDQHHLPTVTILPTCCRMHTVQLVLPYWTDSEERNSARWKLAGVFALTLGTTGVRWAASQAGAQKSPGSSTVLDCQSNWLLTSAVGQFGLAAEARQPVCKRVGRHPSL